MANNGTAVAERSSLTTFIDKMRPRAMEGLAEKMDPDAFMLGIETAIRKTPRLLQCSESSLFIAVATCAEAGLVPLYDLAYMIPRWSKDSNGYEAHFQFGYKGLIDVITRSGRVSSVDSELVREGDEFSYQRGLNPDIHHVPALTVQERIESHVYAIAWPKDRAAKPWFEVMTRAQVEHIRSVSADEKSGAWRNHWGQMARKTAIRRLCNYIPLRQGDRELIEKDDEAAFDFEDAAGEPIKGVTRTEKVAAMIGASEDFEDATADLEGDMPELGGEVSLASLEALAGVGPKDRDAIVSRLGIKSVAHDVDAYAAELRRIAAERQEAES